MTARTPTRRPTTQGSYILVLDSLLVTAILFISTHKASAGIVATIPALLLWGLGQTYKLVHTLLQAGNSSFQVPGEVDE